jgi:anhydro-N-acetylmuramic acid kinase
MADATLFADEINWRALQNIGGIGNVTVVPPRSLGDDRLSLVRAFDTGPGVVLIDTITRRLRPELPFDLDGRLALAGNPVSQVVDSALSHAYFRLMPPKSTGRELFTPEYADSFIEDCRKLGASDEDVIRSAVEFTARSIADQYSRFIDQPIRECVVSGGGAKNPALFSSIGGHLNESGIQLRKFTELFFDGEAKEAVAFAYLGLLNIRGKAGNVPAATGAKGPRVLGVTARA